MRTTKEPEVLTMYYRTSPPDTCDKPNCGGTVFIRHEDGWQCLNCMKITYSAQAIFPVTLQIQDSGAL